MHPGIPHQHCDLMCHGVLCRPLGADFEVLCLSSADAASLIPPVKAALTGGKPGGGPHSIRSPGVLHRRVFRVLVCHLFPHWHALGLHGCCLTLLTSRGDEWTRWGTALCPERLGVVKEACFSSEAAEVRGPFLLKSPVGPLQVPWRCDLMGDNALPCVLLMPWWHSWHSGQPNLASAADVLTPYRSD